MKKTLILILILALSSTLLLTACAPEEPVTDDDLLYGKPRLSKMSDDEILKLMSKLKLMGEYDEDDIPEIKSLITIAEDNINYFAAYSASIYFDIDLLVAYYYNYEPEWYSQYIK